MSLDRYRLRAQLGAGPDGVAYLALAEDGETEVEVRDLSAARRDASRWERLVPRLRMAARLDHPVAIRVLKLGLDHERPYAIMEWAGVTTLADSVKTSGPKTCHETMEVIRAIADALKAAHRLGLPHGRLAPGSVLLAGPTEPRLDFTGAEVGSPGGPEAVAATNDSRLFESSDGESPAADLYNLGSLLAWLLSGQNDRVDPTPTGGDLDGASSLADLIRDLHTSDPSERPTAREVRAARPAVDPAGCYR